MIIYLLTFVLCLIVDQLNDSKYFFFKKAFLFYLYVFFCFGYTTGTDWRFYESLYNEWSDSDLLNNDLDRGFYIFVYFIRKIISDFWLFLGLIKCIYLYAIIRIIKFFSGRVFTILAILMNYQLLFMLIDNPLRFMCGSIFLLLATPFLLNRKPHLYLLFSFFSILFHFSLIVPVTFAFLVTFFEKPFFQSKKNLVLIYAIACLVSLFPFLLTLFSEYLATVFPVFSYRLLENYLMEGIDSSFTFGSLIKLFFFLFLIYIKDEFVRFKYGNFLFYMTFTYLTLSRLLISLPTGFRFSIYFSLFFSIFIFYVIVISKFRIKVFLLLLVALTMGKDLYSSYQFIPYTNSLYHIVFNDHETYYYRDQLNKREFYIRSGKDVDD